MFFLSQNQTTYRNFGSLTCNLPRGNNATALSFLCRNGVGEELYKYDMGGKEVLNINGCEFLFIRYAPCIEDQAISEFDGSFLFQISCDEAFVNTTLNNLEALEKFAIEFEKAVILELERKSNVENPKVTVTNICGVQRRRIETDTSNPGSSFDTANKNLQTSSIEYTITAQTTTICEESCAGKNFTGTEQDLETSVITSLPNVTEVAKTTYTFLASQGLCKNKDRIYVF